MNKIKLLLLLIITPMVIFGQDKPAKESRFDFFAGLTYNFHTFEYSNWNGDGTYNYKSNFPGIEFGFNISPKIDKRLYLSFRNNFLGELLFYGIFQPTESDKIGRPIDYSIGHGFFGRLDLGWRLGKNEKFGAGFVISDKWITGMRGPVFMDPMAPEIEGFHVTPGIYGVFRTPLGSKNQLKAGLSLQQSVFNFWQIESKDKFQYPLFIEADVQLRNHTGIYIGLGSILIVPYTELNPEYRISLSLGYIF